MSRWSYIALASPTGPSQRGELRPVGLDEVELASLKGKIGMHMNPQ